jgi:hypothetical protein
MLIVVDVKATPTPPVRGCVTGEMEGLGGSQRRVPPSSVFLGQTSGLPPLALQHFARVHGAYQLITDLPTE